MRIPRRAGLVKIYVMGGDPAPSRADREVTAEIKAASALLGITLHDHIIVGKNGHASLKGMRLI